MLNQITGVARAPQIILGVQDQQRRRHVPVVGDRRLAEEFLGVVEVAATDVSGREGGADVGGVGEVEEVVARTLGDRRLESIGVPDDP